MRLFILLFAIFNMNIVFASEQVWKLDNGKLEYHVSFPLKKVEGVSTKLKGKAVCKQECDVLVAAPIKSFDSGDTNRDYRVLQLTKSTSQPFVSCELSIKQPIKDSKLAEVKIKFAGKQKIYKNVNLQINLKDKNHIDVNGTIPMKLTDFSITPPSLLGISIEDLIPVDFHTSWSK